MFASRERRPHRSPRATPEEMVALVLAARDRLEADPRAQRGQAAVAWELLAMGVPEAELPKPWTIEGIIRRAGRSKPRRRERGRYEAKGTPYPRRASAVGPGVLHQVDPLGPRYLDGAQEVHSLNVMDVGSHRVALEPLPRPTPQTLAEHLVAAWGRLGIPEVSQFDHAPSLRGEIRGPRRFGPVVRACLDLGVRVRYILLEGPWRNGAIEHFQDVFDNSFFRTERFRDLAHLTERAAEFEAFHDARHRYSTLGGKTPDEAWAASGRATQFPPRRYRVPDTLPRQGHIEAVRLIRSDRMRKPVRREDPDAAGHRAPVRGGHDPRPGADPRRHVLWGGRPRSPSPDPMTSSRSSGLHDVLLVATKCYPLNDVLLVMNHPGASDYTLSMTQRCGASIVDWATYVIEGDPDRRSRTTPPPTAGGVYTR